MTETADSAGSPQLGKPPRKAMFIVFFVVFIDLLGFGIVLPILPITGREYMSPLFEDEAARARLWELADRVFPAYAAYRDTAARTGRTIPIVQLTAR